MTDDQILWVTSYPALLADESGCRLVSSFRGAGRLLVFTEGCGAPAGFRSHRVTFRRLDGDPVLRDFLAANAAVIPTDLGGAWAGPCACPHPADPHAKDHAKGCPSAWFNKHASRWFRKVLAVHRALTDPPGPFKALVWVDVDCRFKRPVPAPAVESWFGGADVFHLKATRKASETGLFGFRGDGRLVSELMLGLYRSGEYKKHDRWDDGYIFDRALDVLAGVTRKDIATRATGHSDVVPNSPAGGFLTHHKGAHSRIKKIYT